MLWERGHLNLLTPQAAFSAASEGSDLFHESYHSGGKVVSSFLQKAQRFNHR